MSIYFSNFNNVDLKHQTSEGIEFYNQPAFSYSNYNNPSYSSNFDKNSFNSASPEEKKEALDTNPFSYDFGGHVVQRSKTDQKDLAWQINKMRGKDIWGFPIDINSQIESDIDSLLQEDMLA